MVTFKKLGLNSELLQGLDDLGFTEPSPIQEQAIPFILNSAKDLIALAQTGTGKTAAFGLPILNQIDKGELQAIILSPTRELCLQISQDIKKYAKRVNNISITPVYGGERIDIQIKALKKGTNIVVGTPGRLNDLIRRRILKLDSVKWVVLDEADEMLDMGFKEELDSILEQTPKQKQTLLFSATLSSKVYSIAKQYMTDIQEISIGEKNIGADNVFHHYYVVKNTDRFEALQRVLGCLPEIYGILFCRTRRETQDLSERLKKDNYDTDAIHGDVSQAMRTKIMSGFKRRQIKLLVATDVAARGIDVQDLSHVINYNLPEQVESYTHRSGRTGRAQKSGITISFVSPRDVRRIKNFEKIIGKNFEYKKVPSGEDVCQKQMSFFLEEIKNINLDTNGNSQYCSEVMDEFKKYSKEELINRFVIQKIGYFTEDNKRNKDLNADTLFGRQKCSFNQVAIKISCGKKQGLDIKGLFKIINSNKKFKTIQIGRIDLMPNYSVFSVAKEFAEEVIKHLSKTKFRGKKIEVQKSNEIISHVQRRKNEKRKAGNQKNRRFKRRR